MPISDTAAATAYLAAVDPVLAAVIQRTGPCTLRPPWGHTLFDALLRSIVYQQLSGKAAATILSRVVALYAPSPTPDPAVMLATDEALLRSAGLSRNKTLALKDLARHAIAGTIPTLAEARALSDDELVERLTELRACGCVHCCSDVRRKRDAPTPARRVGGLQLSARATRSQGSPCCVADVSEGRAEGSRLSCVDAETTGFSRSPAPALRGRARRGCAPGANLDIAGPIGEFAAP